MEMNEKTVNVLFLDWSISRDKIEKTLVSEFKLSQLDLIKSIRDQLREKDDLGNEMLSLINMGELLNTEIIERLLLKNLNGINNNILLTQYPKTTEHYIGLEKLLNEKNMKIDTIWFFKQNQPDVFMNNHFNSKEQIERGTKEFKKRRDQIEAIRETSNNYNWKIIDMDYKSDLEIELIKSKIND